MKPKLLIAAVTAAALAACSKGGDVQVVYKGLTPMTAKAKESDTRSVAFRCTACGFNITDSSQPKICPRPSHECDADILWKDAVGCGYCGASGACPACSMMQQENADCYNCKGTKMLVLMGEKRPCPNCQGTGKCPICTANPGKCDFCNGEKTVPMSTLVTKMAPAKTE